MAPSFQAMKILLTGANGFVGRECAQQLRAAGHQVLSTDRKGPMDLTGDLSDQGFCASLPDVDALIHAAAVQYVSADLPLFSREAYFHRNNVEATRLLVARYSGTSTHFVNVGTSMMYAQNRSPIYRIDSPKQGQGVYSRSKLSAQRFVESAQLHWATLIPCIIGGVGREGLFRGFVKSIVKRGSVVFPGQGRHPIHMVHVQDVASLLRQIVETRAQGFYNAAAPNPLSITDWVREIAEEIGAAPPRIIRLPLRPLQAISALTGYRLLASEQLLMLDQPHVLDIERSLGLGWQPRFENARIARDIGRYIAETSAN
jgi:nucleoside-diphosphate-sugar epimerase